MSNNNYPRDIDPEQKINLLGKYVNIYIIDYEKRAKYEPHRRKLSKFNRPYNYLEFIQLFSNIKNSAKYKLYDIRLTQQLVNAIKLFNYLSDICIYVGNKNMIIDFTQCGHNHYLAYIVNDLNYEMLKINNDVAHNYDYDCYQINERESNDEMSCMFETLHDFDRDKTNIITLRKPTYLYTDNSEVIIIDTKQHTCHKYIYILHTLWNNCKSRIKFNLCKNKKIDKIKTKLKISMFGYIKTILYNDTNLLSINSTQLSLFHINYKFVKKLIYVLHCNGICSELIYIIFKYLRFN